MSKRFGRNQKRKLREAVATAETQNNMLSSICEDREHAVHKLTRDLQRIVQAIESVCPYSICVPVKDIQVKDFPDYYRARGAHLPLSVDILRVDGCVEVCFVDDVKLDQLMCHAEFDYERLATCCHIRLNNNAVSTYYASEDAMASGEHGVLEETARRMAMALAETVRKNRRK